MGLLKACQHQFIKARWQFLDEPLWSPLVTLYFQGVRKCYHYLDAYSVLPSSRAGSRMKRFIEDPPNIRLHLETWGLKMGTTWCHVPKQS